MTEKLNQKSPNKVLAILTTVNYLNYIDRYILAAVLVSIKTELNLSDLQAGLLATAFMIPYMFTSPLFGWLGDTKNRSKILSMGATLWSFASMLTGYAANFVVLLASRFLLGIGESAFTVISVPYLSEHFPLEKRGRVLAIFSTALPVGAALGYVLGGWLGSVLGWRGAFFAVGFPGLIMAFLIWFLRDPRSGGAHVEKFNIAKGLGSIFKSRPYIFAVLGYSAYTYVVGGVAHWVPTYLQRNFALSQMRANLLFGGIAVGSGLVGTLLGGYLGDFMDRKKKGGHLRLSSYSMLIAMPFFVLCLYAKSVPEFMFHLAIAEFFFFISTSPVSVSIIEVAPAHLRTSAMAVAIFLCHILGDAISSPLIGHISDLTGSLQLGMLSCTPIILVSSGLWFIAARIHLRNSKIIE